MSEENIELVRQALEALRRRDLTAWLAVHHDDFEVIPTRDFVEAGVRGPEAAFDLYLKAADAFEQVPIDVNDLVDAGADKDRVLVLAHDRGRRHDMDAEVDVRGGSSWTFREGKILRAEFYPRGEALQAAWKSE
jgi:ketosteroid isomerase-like protein